MSDVETWLLSARLRAVVARLRSGGAAGGDAEAAWREADAAIRAAGAEEDAAVALPVLERDLGEVEALMAGWDSRRVPLPAWDQAVLKRAMNAYKKRLKLTRADDEFSSSRNPLSRGASSGITGVSPPAQYT